MFRGGRAVRGIREHRGGRQPGGVSSVGALRLLEDEDRIQAPYRQDSRPLDRLARCHWSQLGLSHRRPIHPALLHPVFYPPRPLPLMQGPQQQVFPDEYLQRQRRYYHHWEKDHSSRSRLTKSGHITFKQNKKKNSTKYETCGFSIKAFPLFHDIICMCLCCHLCCAFLLLFIFILLLLFVFLFY